MIPSVAEFRQKLRDRLLYPTLEMCAKTVPAYAKLWGDIYREVRKTGDLAKLPIVSKDDLKRNAPDFLSVVDEPVISQNTGGTSGNTLRIIRGKSEIDFIDALYRKLWDQSFSFGYSTPCICAMGDHHGQATPIPYPGPVRHIDFTKTTGCSDVVGVFSRRRSEKKNAIFVGLESQIKIATAQLIECGFNFEQSNVSKIVTTGDFVSSRIRNWLMTTWGVELVDRYSMSEIGGGATPCKECGLLHADPHLIPELVDPLTLRPIFSGHGVLVLSTLAPFVQKQPLVRYFTGDYVNVVKTDCSVDQFAFQLKGRYSKCLVQRRVDRTEPLVCAYSAYDILDNYPDFCRSTGSTAYRGQSWFSAYGHLHISLQAECDELPWKVKIVAETVYPPYMYPQRIQEIAKLIIASLLQKEPFLKYLTRRGEASIAFVPVISGSLERFEPDQIE